MKCSDCGGPPRKTSKEAIARGSKVREPGEVLCEGCSSRRVLMMRAVDRLPTSLVKIRELRANPSAEAMS